MEIIDKKIFEEKEIERLGNRKMILFFDEKEEKFNFFLGRKMYEGETPRSVADVKTGFVFYIESAIKISDDTTLFGERIEFKSSVNVSVDVIKGIYESVVAGLRLGNWNKLAESIKDLSELLMYVDKKEIISKVLGYVGEMLFIKYISEIDISRYRDLARKLFLKYHKKDESKHDFTLNSNLKIEVKATTTENLSFKIKEDQVQGITNSTELYYVFVKTEVIGQSLGGKNLLSIVEDLKRDLDVQDNEIPNHLKIGSHANGWNNHYFDVEDFDIYIVNSKKMPNFEQQKMTGYVSNIEYSLNMIEFTKRINYQKDQVLEEFVAIIEKGI